MPTSPTSAPAEAAAAPPAHPHPPLVLVGPPGVGKSTLARGLAAALGLRHLELDEAIAEVAGMSVEEIFQREGEAGFRIRERLALESALDQGSTVVSAGGGVVADDASWGQLLARAELLALSAPVAVLRRRLAADPARRPLLLDGRGRRLRGAALEGRLQGLLNSRQPRYSQAPLQVDASGSPEQAVARAAAAWRRRRAAEAGEG